LTAIDQNDEEFVAADNHPKEQTRGACGIHGIDENNSGLAHRLPWDLG
jgi:hypothetical protein